VQPLASGDPVQVAGYRLRGRLGSGGMGVVYLAYTAQGQPVALKLLRPDLGDDPAFRARFRQEVDAARRVSGRYTAQVLDADPEASPPWLATAYVPGPSLQEAVATGGPLPAQTALPLVIGVAEALAAIHASGVVHRDLKPSNVLLAADGPRVIDFGIARAVEAAAVTQTGARLGSPQYMAPEQANGGAVTPAADVWALGALACFATTGRAPFGEGGGEAAVLYRVMQGDPDLGGCPPELTGVIWACLAKDPSARPSLAQVIAWCRAESAATAAATAGSWLPPAVAAGLADYAAPPAPAPPAPAPPAPAPPAPAPLPLPAELPAASGSAHGISRWALIAAIAAAAVLIGLAAYAGVTLAHRGNASHNHVADPGRHQPAHRPRAAASTSASPKPSPSSTLDQCLVGTWQQTLEQLPGTIDGITVTFSGGSGVTQVFTSAGVNTITYSNATYTAQEDGNAWTQVDNGTATVTYTTQDHMLLSSDLIQSGTWTLYENGAFSNSGQLSENIEPDRYVCSGNSLQIFAPNGDSIDLTRSG
jgi:serine/threonine protein kinase